MSSQYSANSARCLAILRVSVYLNLEVSAQERLFCLVGPKTGVYFHLKEVSA